MLDDSTRAQIDKALLMAKALYGKGHMKEAQHACNLVLRIDPVNSGALVRLGLIAKHERRLADAIRHFAATLEATPDNLFAARLLIASYREVRSLDVAEDLLATWLQKEPKDADLLFEKGRCLLDRGALAAAASCFETMSAIRPKDPRGFSFLGIVLRRLGEKQKAYAAFTAALALDPRDPAALNGVGNDYLEREDFARAADHFRRALAEEPNFAKARKNYAYALSLLGELAPARGAFEDLLARHPDFADGHMDYGLFLLSIADYGRGWAEYDWRWKSEQYQERDWSGGLPRWDGTPLGRRHLLLWGEQGIGDHILYATMLPDIIARAAGRITVAVEDRLVALFARSLADYPVSVIARGAACDADTHCPFGSMGQWVRRRPDDFSGSGVFLKPDPRRVAELRRRYAAFGRPGDRLIGLSWRSANWHIGHYKSLSLNTLRPILERPGTVWVNLQYGDASQEVAAFTRDTGIVIHSDPDIDSMHDLDGLAAQIAALDGVVSSSNSTVHIAGALGAPCHVLLAQGRGRLWYWPRQGERTPWYDSIRLARQAAPGDWSAALRQLQACLNDDS